MPCRSRRIGNGIGGRVLSMAEDNSKDAFFLITAGVFRVVPSGACGTPRPQPQLPAVLSVGATAVASCAVCLLDDTGRRRADSDWTLLQLQKFLLHPFYLLLLTPVQ